MHRPPFLPLTCVLAIVTAVALLGAADAVTRPAVEPGTNERTKAIVRSFYDAVNNVIRFGDPTSLALATADDLVVQRSGVESGWGRDDLQRYLADLRAATPGLRIEVEDMMADRDRVVARVRLAGVERTDLLSVPSEEGTGWSAIDVFRLEDGKIAAYGGASAELGTARPLLSGVLELDRDGLAFLGLARLSFQPGAKTPVLVSPGPTVYAVEFGQLALRIDGIGFVTRASVVGGAQREEPTVRDRSVRLGPGDRISIGPAVSYTVSADTDSDAVVLAASRMPLGALEPQEFVNGGVSPSVMLSAAMFLPVSSRLPAPWPADVRVEPLVGGALSTLPASSDRVSFERIILAPGTLVRDHEANGSELVAVESGSVLLTRSARLDTDALADAEMPDASGESGGTNEIKALTAGTTAVLAAGETVSMRNAGDAPVAIVLARLDPVAAAAG